MRLFPCFLALLLSGCGTFSQPPLAESEAQLRARRALRDLENAGFRLPGDLDLDWSDRLVRCARGNVCISPALRPEGGGTLLIAPAALQSDAQLRLALLEVWQRLSDGGSMQRPRAFARSTLRQLVSGSRVGVSDPVVLGEVLRAYAAYREETREEERAGLPDPDTYSRELGRFLVPVSLAEPIPEGPSPSLAPQALGELRVFECDKADTYIHPGVVGWEGRQLFWRGVCTAENGDLERAVVDLLDAERLLPHDPRVPLELGEVLCRLGYRKPGIMAFERAAARIQAGEQKADAFRGVARCHMRADDPEAAREAYRKALALDPDDVVTEDWLRWLERQGLLRSGGEVVD